MNGEGADGNNEAGCGWCLSAGDAKGFAKLAIELSQLDRFLFEKKGIERIEILQ
ncbi:MAG: hypothetical protein V8T12_05600 [Parabacteroides johnsonii]